MLIDCASVFVCFWYLFLVLSATQSWKGSKRSACFGPNIIIHSLSDPTYLHIDHIWRIDWDLVFHPTTPKIWFSQWYLARGYSWSPTTTTRRLTGAKFLVVCFCFDVRTPPALPPCSTSVAEHENIGYSLALSGPGAVTIGVGTSRGADSWNIGKLLVDCDGSLYDIVSRARLHIDTGSRGRQPAQETIWNRN